jgi:hypothetical protein
MNRLRLDSNRHGLLDRILRKTASLCGNWAHIAEPIPDARRQDRWRMDDDPGVGRWHAVFLRYDRPRRQWTA